MFRHDGANDQKAVEVTLDGKPVSLPSGVNLAAALLGIGERVSRMSPSSGKPCSPHCLMGVCFECMMEVDGVQRQACLTEVREGMVVNRRLDDGKGGTP